ncbi:hypothetical protein V6N13_044535 [Hibiscus sabdariffa]
MQASEHSIVVLQQVQSSETLKDTWSELLVECVSLSHLCLLLKLLRSYMGLTRQRIWVENDSLTVVKILNSNTIDNNEIGAITWDAKVKAGSFEECKFLFVPRQGNRGAHALASDYVLDLLEEFWVEDAPALVLSMADSDRRCLDPP